MDFKAFNGGVKLVVNTVREVKDICDASSRLSSTMQSPSNDSRGASEVEDFRQSLKELEISSCSFINTGRRFAEHISNEKMITKDESAPERMSRKLKRYLRIVSEYANQLHRYIGDLQPDYTSVYKLSIKHRQRISESSGIQSGEWIRKLLIFLYALLFCSTICSLISYIAYDLHSFKSTRFSNECQPVARYYCYHTLAQYHNGCEQEGVILLKYHPKSYHEITNESKLCILERISHLKCQGAQTYHLPDSVCFYESKLYSKEQMSQFTLLKECQPKSYCYGLAFINDSLLYSLQKLNRNQCLDHVFTAEFYDIYYLMNFTQYQPPSINYCYRLVLYVCSQTKQILKHMHERSSIMVITIIPLPAIIAMVFTFGKNNRVKVMYASNDAVKKLQYDVSEFLGKVQAIKDQLLLFEQCTREMSVCVEHVAAHELPGDIDGQLKRLQMEIQPIADYHKGCHIYQ